MADDLNKEAPALIRPVVSALPEFVPPAGARPRQSKQAELTEKTVLVPFGILAGSAFKRYVWPDADAVEIGAVAAATPLVMLYISEHLRDWRWRGRTKEEE
jgi:hypothetical protein